MTATAKAANYYTITSFVDSLKGDTKANRVEVYLDETMFPNDYGINVRPLRVTLWSGLQRTVYNMTNLIEHFHGIPYIRVTETKHRRLSRNGCLLIIDCSSKKTYEGHDFYEYKVMKLFLQDECSQYNDILHRAHDVIVNYLESLHSLNQTDDASSVCSPDESHEELHPDEVEIV